MANADYGPITATVTFAPGEAAKSVSIPILNDALSEGAESFGVSILRVTGDSLGFPRTTRVIIQDDESQSSEATPDPSSLTVTPETTVITGLVGPISFIFVPGQPTTLLIAEKSGLIKVARDGVVSDTPLLDLRSIVNDVGDRGLIDIELHPDFPNQPYLYAYSTVDPAETAANAAGSNAGPDGIGNRFVHLVRFTVDTNGGQLQVRPGSQVVLLGGAGRSLQDISGGGAVDSTDNFILAPSGIRADGTNVEDYIAADSLSHAGGDMEFGPDGALYVSVGDGTSFNFADPRSVRVQDLGNLSGKVLRVDPLTGDGLASNPFFVAGQPDTNQSKVYQLGIRNSFRMAFDAEGDLFLGDVGWYSWEEINTGGPGANFGWPYYEGGQNGVSLQTAQYRELAQAQAFYASNVPVMAPFQAFSHVESDPGFAIQAIVVGEVYTGSLYPGLLRNDLFFSSLTAGQVFSVDVNAPARNVSLLATQNATIVSVEHGPDGALYYADIVSGTIGRWQILAVTASGAGSRTIGAGPDTLIFRLQQDAYLGDAQYTVSVDGVQIGGVQTAGATRASGQFDALTVLGDFAPGQHRAEVNFLNDAYGGSAETDRNLYVTTVFYNGDVVTFTPTALERPGPAAFTFQDIRLATTIGTGPDALVLQIQQDAYLGDAQYTVSIDGVQIGGVQTASATRASGQFDTVTVLADLSPGPHRAEVRFLNDAYGGSPATDRNLYVNGATYNGDLVDFTARELLVPGLAAINFQEARLDNSIGTGPDTLVLRLRQDAYLGNAQYTVSVDGVQIGGTLEASSTRASGQFDTLTVRGDFAAGSHRAEVRFLNDLYGGTPTTDRNLFVDGATYNGDTITFTAQELFSAGSASFSFVDQGAATTIGAGPDALELRLQQDAYLGNAQFTVSVDGVQIDGVLDAIATRSSGQSDRLIVRGTFAAGDHRLEVRFLNDAYNGTPETDRNLFVTGASYNGTALASSTRDLFSAGPALITFTDVV